MSDPVDPYTPPDAPSKAKPKLSLSDAIALSVNDIGSKRLLSALTGGPGFRAPRTLGGVCIFVGLGNIAFNVVQLLKDGHYFPQLAALAFLFLLPGLFLLVVGEPADQGRSPPRWTRVGLAVSIVLGGGLGVFIAVAMHG